MSTPPIIEDPAATYERCCQNLAKAEARVRAYELSGLHSAAKLARRRAAGYKATMTRIRRQWWGEPTIQATQDTGRDT